LQQIPLPDSVPGFFLAKEMPTFAPPDSKGSVFRIINISVHQLHHMGRAFEFRKERKMKRWAGMAKTFTRIGREIALAVKSAGPNAEYNSRLRIAIQNAKSANMPKSNVENAIKNASSKEAENFQEVVYEGYAPHGVAVLVETATNNPTRTVANVRMYFDRGGGALGTFGSVSFMFNRKGVFKVKADGQNWDDLELELIDAGLEEMKREDEEVVLFTDFKDFGTMQKALEDRNIEPSTAQLEWIPTLTKKLSDSEVEQVIKLIDRLEDDEDVLNVFHTMDMSE
jgi:YebC/PmpR family DNA-binding regulatory protein